MPQLPAWAAWAAWSWGSRLVFEAVGEDLWKIHGKQMGMDQYL